MKIHMEVVAAGAIKATIRIRGDSNACLFPLASIDDHIVAGLKTIHRYIDYTVFRSFVS